MPWVGRAGDSPGRQVACGGIPQAGPQTPHHGEEWSGPTGGGRGRTATNPQAPGPCAQDPQGTEPPADCPQAPGVWALSVTDREGLVSARLRAESSGEAGRARCWLASGSRGQQRVIYPLGLLRAPGLPLPPWPSAGCGGYRRQGRSCPRGWTPGGGGCSCSCSGQESPWAPRGPLQRRWGIYPPLPPILEAYEGQVAVEVRVGTTGPRGLSLTLSPRAGATGRPRLSDFSAKAAWVPLLRSSSSPWLLD